MGLQKGFIKLKGSLGGLTFYEKNGENIVRTTGGIDKERIAKDPSFKRTRENMAEFGGAAKTGKALRMGFANIIKTMADNRIVGRLTGIMKKVNTHGTGLRGQRSFEILKNANIIQGFEFNKTFPLGAIFYAPTQAPTLDANRSIVTWVVPDFDTDSFITVPEGATHFKLVLATTVLSDYTYEVSSKSFVPVNPAENQRNGVAFSDAIAIGGMAGSDITLTVDLGFDSALPATAGVISATGIIFYQEINSQLYELAGSNAMRIEAIE
ncbi:hypothetical protein [Abyssalbus ytuae]|uniref:Uncharacterized protein n=1 Tax=Abyssalbus ytuae TaxID=2926907 RepID=A0A9E6ZKN7_9FLAO|nr:hypothetical protein [Abyssalbus ytuae]UOB17489.1 hypothetical protein MQE35_17350 [Abyssalbus ytuae]